MCAIFGSFNKRKFTKLAEKNGYRGSHSYSISIYDPIKKDIRLVHISTDEVYGDLKEKESSSEKSAYKPSSPYSACKASADHLIKSYVRT